MGPLDWESSSLTFPTKKDVPIFDEGNLSNNGNSPSICSTFSSISQKEEQRDFDDSTKNKNQETMNTINKNDSDELTEETNDTPIEVFSSFEAKQRLQPEDWKRVELRYWGKQRLPQISDVNRKLSSTKTLALITSNFETCSRIP